jgi:hypothetical protein
MVISNQNSITLHIRGARKPGAPQHPPDTGTEGVEEDIEKFEADISL